VTSLQPSQRQLTNVSNGDGAATSASSVRRWLLLGPIVGVAIVGLVYLAASAYITDSATHAARTPVEGTPSDLGLRYEPVTFESAADRIPLQGWYLPSRGERGVIIVHGISKTRWNSWERTADKAQFLVEHGFDVLVFDLRGHGNLRVIGLDLAGWNAMTCAARSNTWSGVASLRGESAC